MDTNPLRRTRHLNQCSPRRHLNSEQTIKYQGRPGTMNRVVNPHSFEGPHLPAVLFLRLPVCPYKQDKASPLDEETGEQNQTREQEALSVVEAALSASPPSHTRRPWPLGPRAFTGQAGTRDGVRPWTGRESRAENSGAHQTMTLVQSAQPARHRPPLRSEGTHTDTKQEKHKQPRGLGGARWEHLRKQSSSSCCRAWAKSRYIKKLATQS